MKDVFYVVQVVYPLKHKMIVNSFDNLRDAENCAFGYNMNRTSGKVEYLVEQEAD